MERQLAEGKLGEVAKYDLDFKEGSVVASLEGGAGPLSGKLEVKLDGLAVSKLVLTKLKELIPGHFDDVLLDAAVAKLEELAKAK